MSLILNRQTLSAALRDILPITVSRSTLPILSNILFSNAGSYVTLSGSNLECFISIDIDANECDMPDFVIEARLLSSWLSNQITEFVEFDVKDDHVILRSGKSKTKVNVLSADEFPNIATYNKNGLAVDPLQFSQALSQAVLGASSQPNETRQYTRGVHMALKNNRMLLTGMNGIYMVHRELVVPITQDGEIGIMPYRNISALTKLLANAITDANILPTEKGVNISFDAKPYKHVNFQTQLIIAKYIDYERLVPKESDLCMTLNRDELLRALANGLLFAEDDADRIYMETDPFGIFVRAKSNIRGENEDYLVATTTAGELVNSFLLNGKYLAAWVRAQNTDTIQMEACNGGKTPLIFKDAEALDAGYFLLPPMILKGEQ